MSRRLDNLCDDASASLFGGVTGSSSTSNPVTNTVTGAGTTSGQIEAGGNVNASNEQITGETVSQSITNTGVPVSDLDGLLDTAFSTLSTLSNNNAATVNNAGITAQTAEASASGSSNDTLIAVAVGGVLLLLAVVMLARHH